MIIYKITNNITGKSYIGQTQFFLEFRWKQHLCESRINRKPNKFRNAIRKYGIECWKFEIIEVVECFDDLNKKEQYWISFFDAMKCGYNSTSGGEGGRIISNETKEKIRIGHLGRKSPLRGVPRSEETKRKISETKTGRRSPSTILLNKSRTGIPHTKEHNKKISKALLGTKNSFFGRKHSEETKERIRQTQINKKRKEGVVLV